MKTAPKIDIVNQPAIGKKIIYPIAPNGPSGLFSFTRKPSIMPVIAEMR